MTVVYILLSKNSYRHARGTLHISSEERRLKSPGLHVTLNFGIIGPLDVIFFIVNIYAVIRPMLLGQRNLST